MTLTDKDILEQLRCSNEQAFETVFKTYYERLCNYANTILNDIDESEEMVQGAFLTIWEKRDSIEIHSSVKSYLYRAVYNSCLNRVKHLKVQRRHETYYKHSTSQGHEGASERVIESELQTITKNAIESLPPQCKMVFTLSRFENLTYAEIAAQLNISVKTVENHMVKALRTLRVKLKDYLPLIIWMLIMKNWN